MINLYSGTPGSGKSLHCSRTIKRLNNSRIPIITNILINKKFLRYPQLYIYVPFDRLNTQFLKNFYYSYLQFTKKDRLKENSIYLIIDECQMIFNSRDYSKSDRRDWLKFFSIHRHLGYSVILICQFDKMLDKQIRALIENEFIHRRLGNCGFFGQIVETLFFRRKIFLILCFWYPLHMHLYTEWCFGHRRLYRLYDTFTINF